MSASSSSPSNGFRTATVGLTVRIIGTSIEAPIEASGRFELNDVAEGNVDLRFSGPGIDATISIEGVTAKERIELTVTVTGSSAAIEKENRQTADSRINVSGKITSINLAASSFGIGEFTAHVTAATSIRRGSEVVPLTDLRVGDEVRAKGVRNGSTIEAEQVEVPGYRTQSGIVSDLSGICPTLTFRLDGQKISTDGATTYTGSACATVKNGEQRSVSGLKSEGVLVARYVSAGEAVPSKESKEEKKEDRKEDKDKDKEDKDKKDKDQEGKKEIAM